MNKDVKTLLMILGTWYVLTSIYRAGQKSVREGRV